MNQGNGQMERMADKAEEIRMNMTMQRLMRAGCFLVLLSGFVLAGEDRAQQLNGQNPAYVPTDYRIGPDDQLDIKVFEAPELNHELRVSATGEISLALIGTVHAEGLTPQGLEFVIVDLLRRTFIKNPHVSVQVRDMQSHSVSVFGAVKKPGVFQIRQPKTVIELLSMAEGLDVGAGDSVIVEHRGGHSAAPGTGASEANSSAGDSSSSTTVELDLKKLLETGDPSLNVLVYSGDVVKVPRAGLIYVVGEVKKPGGYELKSNENISVLQALALAEGLTLTSSSSLARIIRTDGVSGQRQEIPINLNKILAGKQTDPMLEARDIVFVPNSAARNAVYRGMEAAISIGTGVAIYRR
jgi:polysaccharide biosynthesis/export protein